MKLVETIAEMRRLRSNLPEPVGFVPTMGYLHEGHLALVKQARLDNASVVASIYVNPTQFGPHEDYHSYPRDLKRDLSLLKNHDTDVVFAPSSSELYPSNFNSWVDVEKITDCLEGAYRPGHFRGVATVVAKLFNIIQPTKAYFGQKDAQQLMVIKKMAADLNMNLEVIAVPTVREPDGLAMSSRNTYLDPEERKASAVLYHSLRYAEELWIHGERDAEKLRNEIHSLIKREPLADIDYVSIADVENLEELDNIRSAALISLAVKFGSTRLIDNIVLKENQVPTPS